MPNLLNAIPAAYMEHHDFHKEEKFHLILISVSEKSWYATDTGDAPISDYVLQGALLSVAEGLSPENESSEPILSGSSRTH